MEGSAKYTVLYVGGSEKDHSRLMSGIPPVFQLTCTGSLEKAAGLLEKNHLHVLAVSLDDYRNEIVEFIRRSKEIRPDLKILLFLSKSDGLLTIKGLDIPGVQYCYLDSFNTDGILIALFNLIKSPSDISPAGQRSFIENIPIVIFRCKLDQDWTMLYVSDTITKLCGYSPGEFVQNGQRSFASIIHPDDRTLVENTILEAVRKKKRYEIEYRILHKTKDVRWIYEKGLVLDHPNGEKYLEGVLMDVTRRKMALLALDRERTLVQSLMNNIPDNIYFKDARSRFISINKSMARYFGLSDERKALGKTDFNFFTKEHAQQAFDDEKEIIRTGTPVIKEEKETWPDGRISWMSTIKLPLRNAHGEINGTFGISRDITKKKQEEESRWLNEQRLDSLVDISNALDGTEYEIIKLALQEATHLAQSKLGIFHLLGPQEKGKDLIIWPEKLGDRYKNDEGELVVDQKNCFWLHCLEKGSAMIENDTGHDPGPEESLIRRFSITGYLSIPVREEDEVVAIATVANKKGSYTEEECNQLDLFFNSFWELMIKKRRTEELNQARSEAIEANEAKSRFLANMSHEIRTPMNAILGYAEILTPLVNDPTQRHYLEAIKLSGKSLLTLINDILDLSKIEAGKLELQFGFIDTQLFFNELEQIFSLKIKEKGLDFFLEISSSTPAALYVDEIRLRQVLINLLGNAVKFTEKGHVKLSVWPENLQITEYKTGRVDEYLDLIIEVEDTGVGISKEYQQKIFEAFQQQEDTDVKKFGGTGLGLAISTRLVEMMNGSLTVNSNLNKGSIFRVTVPDVAFLRDFEEKQKGLYINPDQVVFGESTILVVDDVEHNRKLLIDTLRNTNLKILEAENGDVAIKLAAELVPDLIIADIRMPLMNGFELLEKLKANDKLKHIPVIAYSASVMKSQKERIHNSAFSGLLMKPVLTTELYLELINNLPHEILLPDEPTAGESGSEGSGHIENLSALLEELESGLYSTWESFEKRQPMDEVREFGEKLVQLGKSFRATGLESYGRDLVTAIEDFNIQETLTLLRKYPKVIDKLKHQQNGNR